MEVTVAQRAHRGLRGLAGYVVPGELGNASLSSPLRDRLVVGEVPIGVYENVSGSHDQSILITDCGLHFNDNDNWLFVPYEEMVSAEMEGGEKALATGHVAIQLRGEATFLLPVLGGGPTIGTKDTFAVLMFLNHVIGDINRVRACTPAHSLEES